jgi:general secretion pathway protein N
MSRRRSAALLPLLLIAGCAALGWKIYDDWSAASADAAAAPASADVAGAVPDAPPAAADLALSLPPPERFAVIVERPLFSPTRRPAPPAAEQAQAEEPALESPAEPETAPEGPPPPTVDFTLVGIVIAGSERYALVERHVDGRVVEVAEGGDVGGWFAVLIDPDRAVFRQGAVEEELVLKYESPVPPERIPPPRAVPPPPEPAPAEPVQPTEVPQEHQ